ncbi:MAG: hydrogenase maturation protease [Casimicrobiaceae bacterium]
MSAAASTEHACRILIAGVGNVLQGDDGFGVVVAHRLMGRTDLPPGAKVIETGIGGMTLIQELMLGYDALVIVDAFKKGGPPGRLYLLEPELPDLSHLDPHELRDYFADTHYATPMRALTLLARIDSLPPTIRIVGCEPETLDELKIGLSAPATAAVDAAVEMIVDWANLQSRHALPRNE